MAEFTLITRLAFLLTWEHHGKVYSLYVLMNLHVDENAKFLPYFVINWKGRYIDFDVILANFATRA